MAKWGGLAVVAWMGHKAVRLLHTVTCCPKGVRSEDRVKLYPTFKKKGRKAVRIREEPSPRPFSTEPETWE